MNKHEKFSWQQFKYPSNIVSLLGIPFAGICLYYVANQQFLLAFGWGFLSASTDYVDGWLARKLKQCTELGLILEPLKDNLILLAGAIVIYIYLSVSIYLFVAIIIYMVLKTIGFIACINKVDLRIPIPATFPSKFAANAISIVLLLYILKSADYEMIKPAVLFYESYISVPFDVIAIFSIIWSLIDYSLVANSMLNQKKA